MCRSQQGALQWPQRTRILAGTLLKLKLVIQEANYSIINEKKYIHLWRPNMNTELRTFQLMVEAQSYYLNKDVHKG